MIKATFKVMSPTGVLISCEKIISVFDVYYYYHKHDAVYFLIPKQQHDDFVLIVANTTGVRIVDGITWLRGMVYDILVMAQCPNSNNFLRHIEDIANIPNDVYIKLCQELLNNPVTKKYFESM